ncbi:hypothetical protein KJ786_00195 [Patescibacteria group bacterium]|nr:hypothetical protein [Patescibacteria group bacterium]
MSSVAENLERHYRAFIDQQNEWGFFLGLAYYVNFILETPETDKITDLLLKERRNEEKKIKDLGDEVLKEVEPVIKDLIRKIQNAKISYPALDNEIKDYEGYKNKTIKGSEPPPVCFGRILHNTIRSLSENGHKELVKDYIREERGILYTDKHKFSKKLYAYNLARKKYDEKLEITFWGFWDYISFAYLAVLKADETLENLRREKADWFTISNLVGYFGEMKTIKDGDIRDLIVEFKREKYEPYATNLHNYLLKELSTNNKKAKQKVEIGKSGKIKKITIIELKDRKHLLAVNDDYKNVKKIRKSKYYPIFIEEIAKREVLNRTDNNKISNEMAEYFNNNKKCLAYMNGKYGLTAIFTGDEEEREINWEIKTEIINEDDYLKRLRKITKK